MMKQKFTFKFLSEYKEKNPVLLWRKEKTLDFDSIPS